MKCAAQMRYQLKSPSLTVSLKTSSKPKRYDIVSDKSIESTQYFSDNNLLRAYARAHTNARSAHLIIAIEWSVVVCAFDANIVYDVVSD